LSSPNARANWQDRKAFQRKSAAVRARWAELPTKTNRQNRSIAFDYVLADRRRRCRSFYGAEALTAAAGFGVRGKVFIALTGPEQKAPLIANCPTGP
jgi:hypothetical protein